MSKEQPIQRKDNTQISNNVNSAMNALKDAGMSGDMSAALSYAYHNAGSNPEEAVRYLETTPFINLPIVQYHLLLIAYFGGMEAESDKVASKLVALTNQGVIESGLVLLSYLPAETGAFLYVAQHVKKLSPNIYRQLDLDRFLNINDVASSVDEVVEMVSASLTACSAKLTMEASSLPIKVYENVLSAYESQYLITKFSGMLAPAMVVDPITGKGIADSIRTNYIATIAPHMTDWITRKLEMMIADLTGTKANEGEAFSLLRYEPGQEYKPHYDALNVGRDNTIYKDGGQRVKTALLYLNTVKDGGDTSFPKLNIKIAPVMGNLLVFPNTDRDGKVILDSYHAGEKTTETNKWLVTKWIRENTTEYGRLLYGN